LDASDETRLSVVIVNVHPGREDEFLQLAVRLKETLERQTYCVQAQTIRDEGVPTCFYLVWRWVNADAARRSHADREVSELSTELHRVGLVTHAINGARERTPTETDQRRVFKEWNRRDGLDRRVKDIGPVGVERRVLTQRRFGPRRQWERASDIVGAARRAREHASAQFSQFKVGAAVETSDGTIVTGCNVENATYGLTICAERVAMFKALSEGHRAFTRIAIVADTQAPTPPCGACRQILWEFGGNLEVRLANLTAEKGTYHLKDLLPFPFDARLLGEA
jgi:cytidine deaminase